MKERVGPIACALVALYFLPHGFEEQGWKALVSVPFLVFAVCVIQAVRPTRFLWGALLFQVLLACLMFLSPMTEVDADDRVIVVVVMLSLGALLLLGRPASRASSSGRSRAASA